MRVTTTSIDEFLQCLVDIDEVFGSTVRVSITRNPVDGTKRDSTKFTVVIQASTIVIDDGSEYLLETGQFCGIDYTDATQQKDGSEIANVLKERVIAFALKKNWKVLPGIISE